MYKKSSFGVLSALVCLFFIYFALSCSAASGFSRIPSAHDSLGTKVDALFSEYDKSNTPGGAVAIVKGGTVIYVKGYGCANLEHDIPITTSTVFNLASVSKHITAYCVFLLESEGKLSIEDDIRSYIPELPDFGQTIQLTHLLHHTSGLRDPYGLMYLRGWDPLDVLKNADVIRLLKQQKELNNEPGNSYLYSSSNYVLLSEIIKRVSGKTLPEWAKDNIFDPLGMKNTFYNDATEGRLVKNRADAYQLSSRGDIFNFSHLSSLVGTGGIYTSAEDIALWLKNIFETKVGTAETIDRLFQLEKLNDGTVHPYACGLNKNLNQRGYVYYTHDGQIGGYKTFIGLFPDDQLGVVVMGNFLSLRPWPILQKIADLFIDDLWADPSEETQKKTERSADEPEIRIDKSVYDDYAGKYILKEMNLTFEIIQKNLKLFIQGKAFGRRELLPEMENSFIVSGNVGKVTFVRNQEKAVDRLVLNSRGREMTCLRIDGGYSSEVIKPEQIQDYCGVYRSDEIDVSIHIEYTGNLFIAKHIMYEDLHLTPLSAEVWEGPHNFINTLKFFRDESGKIKGFRLTGHRVINLLFEKAAY